MDKKFKHNVNLLFILIDLAEDLLAEVYKDLKLEYAIKAETAILAIKVALNSIKKWTNVVKTLEPKEVDKFDKDKKIVKQLIAFNTKAYQYKIEKEFIEHCEKFFNDKNIS